MDPNAQSLVAQRLAQSANVLVTVSNSPTVDQLSAAIGLTIMLNKMGKHCVAVFSGDVPGVMEFLEPKKTFENSVEGLQDFIITLSKDKADKLRYKVEDEVVKIFITPYKDKITKEDLNFSQGDYNVDSIVALGVINREDLDAAITSHGRILHDATVISVTNGEHESHMGAINWHDPSASSLSEMLVMISEAIQPGLVDGAVATALLTGVVSATERFSNALTTPRVMTMSAQLMSLGANQQLIASNLKIGPTVAKVEKKKEESIAVNLHAEQAQKKDEEPKPMEMETDNKPDGGAEKPPLTASESIEPSQEFKPPEMAPMPEPAKEEETPILPPIETPQDSKPPEMAPMPEPEPTVGALPPSETPQEIKLPEPASEPDLNAPPSFDMPDLPSPSQNDAPVSGLDIPPPSEKPLEPPKLPEPLTEVSNPPLPPIESASDINLPEPTKTPDINLPQNLDEPKMGDMAPLPPPPPIPTLQPPKPDESSDGFKPKDRDLLGSATGFGPTEASPAQPNTGGTFSATSYQAHEDKEDIRRRDMQADIMTHSQSDVTKVMPPPPPPNSEDLARELEEARKAVEQAIEADTDVSNKPIQSFGAQPMNMDQTPAPMPPPDAFAPPQPPGGAGMMPPPTPPPFPGAPAQPSMMPPAPDQSMQAPLPPPPPPPM